jgi:TRAP-type transport system periplasmic protein
MLKKYLFTTATIAAIAIASPVQAVEIKTTGCWQRNHDYIEGFHKGFVEPLNAKKGAVTIKYLGGPEVTPFQKQGQSLQRGLVDLIICAAAYYGGTMAEARIPGAQNKPIEEIRSNGGWELMQEAWGKGLNSRILAWTHFKGQKFYLYTRFKPKESTKTGVDLSGMKMRATSLYKAFLTAMGATPIVISPSEVYTGLERGVVDGMAWPWGSISTYGWQKFLKYRIKPDFFGASVITAINLDKWKSLSKAERDLIEAQAREYEKIADEVVVAKGMKDDEALKKAGVQDIELTGEAGKAYVRTIYEAKWAENDSYRSKFNVDYDKLKAALYEPVK